MAVQALVAVLWGLAMAYGIASMALAYLGAETRGIAEGRFLLLAVMLPAAALFGAPYQELCILRGWATLRSSSSAFAFLGLPAALAYLFLVGRAIESEGRRTLDERWTRMHAEAALALERARKTSLVSRLCSPRFESCLIILAAVLAVWNLPLALQLGGYMIFIRWFHGRPDAVLT